MAKEVVVGTLNTLYTAENIQEEEFNPADFHLGDELFSAVDDTWQSLKDTFSLSVLANPIEASKGDGEMGTGAMGVMSEKFGSASAAYSYDLRPALHSVHLGDGGHCPRVEPRLDGILGSVGAEYRLLAGNGVLPDGQF